MRRVSRSLPIVVVLSAWAVTACGPSGQPGGGPPRGAPDVAVVTIAPQRAVLTAELAGRTLPYAVSDVRPQVSGILKARLFVEGSLVEAGQALYQIDDTLYRAAYDSAKAQLANARAALTTATLKAQRYTALRKDKSISQQDYDDAQAALQQALANVAQQEANVATARINLGYTRIIAPIRGRIGRSYLTQGALVTANQDEALATIQTLDPIYVDMNQSSSELLALRNAIAAGQVSDAAAAVTLTLDEGTRYPIEGALQFREVVVEPTTGTVTLRAQFPNPDGVLLPGMFVRATIIEGVEPNALLVPQRGVSRDDKGNATALVVDADGIVQRRLLTVTQTIGANWLVKSGIAAGERVIVEGLQYARPGEKANAVAFDAADAPNAPAAPAPQPQQQQQQK
jgi:membrane fusion protein, multidrug efflux system